MQFNHPWKLFLIIGLLWCGSVSSVVSQTKSETFLPSTTEGVLIVSDISDFVNGFNSTQLGELCGNPEITVFFESIQRKLDKQLAKEGFDLGAKTDEIVNVVSGEMSIALIRPAAKESAVCFLADVANDPAGAEGLLKRASERIKAKGGKEAPGFKEGGVEITALALPREKGDREIIIYSTVVANWLVAAKNKAVTQSIVRKIQGRADTDATYLADDVAFQTVMARCDTKRDLNNSYVKWFVKPLEFAENVRGRLPKSMDDKDYIGMLKKHGYDSIQGIGGILGVGLDEYDILAQCYIYAPPVGKERFVKAVAALDFENLSSIDLLPEKWIPAGAASHLSFTWDLKKAFEKSIPLIEELVGREGTIKKALEGIKNDQQGAKVDIENDIIAQLGKKITLVSDPNMPVTNDNERLLLLVKIDGDQEKVKVALDKLIAVEGRNGGVISHDYKGFNLWEVHPGELREKRSEHHADPNVDPNVEIPGVDCSATESGEGEEEKNEADVMPLLKKPLVATQIFVVAHGHLIITNNLEYSKLLLDNAENPPAKSMRDEKDFQQVDEALNDLVKNADSLRRYTRLDNAYRSTYELIRNGKLPESKSLLATIINSLIPAEEEDKPRAPRVDGSLLPKDFDKDVAPYLGNIGWCLKTEPEGWLITSILVAREE